MVGKYQVFFDDKSEGGIGVGIAFIGLVVPHIAKLAFRTSSHLVLFWASLLTGAIILLICDTFTQLPGSENVLPINAITSIIGAPIVIWLLMRKQKGVFS